MSRFRNFLKGYFYAKMAFNRANGYFGMPINLFKDFALVTMWGKLYLGGIDFWLVIVLFTFMFLGTMLIGHLDIKYKMAHEETRINNSINPELMSIYSRTVKNGKKTEKKK